MNVIQKKRVTWSTLWAFGRIDLAGTLAALMLLAMLMVACGAMNRTATESAVCRNNHRRLMAAWIAHAQENGQLLRPTLGATGLVSEWGRGWMDWSIRADNTNVASILTPDFKPYIGGEPSVFRCPSDRFLSLQQKALGWQYRVRTYSVNGRFNNSSDHIQYSTLSDLTMPSATFVFAEQHPEGIDDGAFDVFFDLTDRRRNRGVCERPASFHDRSATFGFADGHVELHRWVGAKIVKPVEPVIGTGDAYGVFRVEIYGDGDPDVLWVLNRSIQP